MRKIFTLAAAALMSIGMWAAYPTATTTYALEDLTVTEATLTYEKTGLSGDAQKLNKVLYVQVEVPCASANGNLYLRGTSSNTGRFATIWGSNGTARDEARKVAMKNGNSDAIAFTEADILEDGGKYYIRFSSADNNGSYFDYKISGFSYVLAEECVTKEIDHVVKTLTGAAINGVALDATEMSTLLNNGDFEDPTFYVEAPTVTFTVQTDTYYVGEETPSTKSEDIDVVAELAAGMWMAQYTIGENTYTIKATKPETRTITFMDGETVLGTEVVAKGDPSTKHAEFETKPLANFEGWFKNSNFTSQIDIATYAINEDQTLYGKFVKAYAQSIDFEGMVLNQGKSYDVKSALMANFYDYKTIDALDSLNNSKGAARNEPYLGLKIKKQGGYLACNVLPGTTLRIKFGYVAETVLAIAGNDTLRLVPTDNKLAELTVPFAIEKLVKLQTTSDKTVVIKQIMVDDPIVTWMYPITYTAGENGTIEGWTIALPGEEVKVSHAAAEGYRTYSLTYNGVALHDDENKGYVTFTMPAEAVAVEAEFLQEFPTAIENSEVEVKAVKVIRDGKLFIEKNGVLYDAQGVVVK